MSKVINISDVCPLIFKSENNSRKGVYNRSETQKSGVLNDVTQIFDSETLATNIYFEANTGSARYTVFKNGSPIFGYTEKACTRLANFLGVSVDVLGFEIIESGYDSNYGKNVYKIAFSTTGYPQWTYIFNSNSFTSTEKIPYWITKNMNFGCDLTSQRCIVEDITYNGTVQQEIIVVSLLNWSGVITNDSTFTFSNINIEDCNVFSFSLPNDGLGQYNIKLELYYNANWDTNFVSECYTLRDESVESDVLLSYWSEEERYNGFLYNYSRNGIDLSIRNNLLLSDVGIDYLDFSTDTDSTFEEQMQSFERLNGYIPKVVSFDVMGKTGIEIQRIKSIIKHDVLYINYQKCVQIGEVTTERQGENIYSLSAKLALIDSDFYQKSQADIFVYLPNPVNAECLQGTASYVLNKMNNAGKARLIVTRTFADGGSVSVTVKYAAIGVGTFTQVITFSGNDLNAYYDTTYNYDNVTSYYIYSVVGQEAKNTGVVHFDKLEQYNTITGAFTGVEIDNEIGVVGYTADYYDRELCPEEDVRTQCEIYGELTFAEIGASQYDSDIYNCTFEEIKSE